MSTYRVRFAPSPTGALHIGGVRTALYNYLLARRHGGQFILRIEDTDQNRYVEGAEEFILESLRWCGIEPDEGPATGGPYGPYRQSERKEIYREYAERLVASGDAYYAFDTPEELEAARDTARAAGDHSFRYDSQTRGKMRNSLSLDPAEVQRLIEAGVPYTVRLLVPEDEEIAFEDAIREVVRFQGSELDDKVILKGDGWPTYHLANVVDDHLMQITHVVRGEEWLSSTAHHVLLYRFLGWEGSMPAFAHLPLILKPSGKGKLSKRDGTRLGIPVFPIDWDAQGASAHAEGFRERGFLPQAMLNFLAFLGWNPGTEQEIFSLDELVEAFDLAQIGKSGARFDFEKALWFNQQYIAALSAADLAEAVMPWLQRAGVQPERSYLEAVCSLMGERMTLLGDLWEQGHFFFQPVHVYDDKNAAKRWSGERYAQLQKLDQALQRLDAFDSAHLKEAIMAFMEAEGLKFGQLFPLLRIALTGSMQGPDVYETMAVLGRESVHRRLQAAMEHFNGLS